MVWAHERFVKNWSKARETGSFMLSIGRGCMHAWAALTESGQGRGLVSGVNQGATEGARALAVRKPGRRMLSVELCKRTVWSHAEAAGLKFAVEDYHLVTCVLTKEGGEGRQ